MASDVKELVADLRTCAVGNPRRELMERAADVLEGQKVGYMCRIVFEEELGEAVGGSVAFSSVRDLKRHNRCCASGECGIVEVGVTQRRIVEKGEIYGD